MNKQCRQYLADVRKLAVYLSSLALILLTAQLYVLNAQEIMRFAVIGDFGDGSNNERDVANLVKSWNPDFIITTGDNNYPDGEASTIDRNIGQFYHQFIFPYNGAYGPGATSNRFFPAMGNHDWDNNVGDPGQPYFEYFTLPGNERYYDFVMGPVHFFMIDSDRREPDGITSSSRQAAWLRQRLAASTAEWRIVVLHHPPFSSRTSWPKLQWPYQDWGADVVLAGHAHVYERIVRNGLPYITNGLGGDSTGSFGSGTTGSVCRFGSNFGAQLVTVSSTSITFQFTTRSGVIIDTYTLGPDAVTPSAPGNLTAGNISNGRSNLTWNDNAINEDGYRIEQSTNGGSFIQIGSTIANATSFTAADLNLGNIYSFRVRAANNAGFSGYSNNANLPGDSTPSPPADPSNLNATAASATQINLSWTDNSQVESGYKIERCTGSTCTNFAEVNQTGANTVSFQDSGLTASTAYRYRVRAFNTAGNSGYSNIDGATTLASSGGTLEPPTNLAASAASTTQINLSWTDDSDIEDGFKIERCSGSGCINFAEIDSVGANVRTYSDTGLAGQTLYRYRVRAFAGLTDTAYSNIAEATTQGTQPPPTGSLVDDFNDGVRDTAKWQLGILSRSSSVYDPQIPVSEQGGRLSITPRSSLTVSSYNGYVSVAGWDLTGANASVEVVQITANTAVTIISAGINADNWYSFRAKGSTLYLESRINGTTTSTTLSYSATLHRFWRLRHDVSTDSIVFETSADGASWTARRSVARQISITALKIELVAGTTSAIASPGTALFDNFVLQSN